MKSRNIMQAGSLTCAASDQKYRMQDEKSACLLSGKAELRISAAFHTAESRDLGSRQVPGSRQIRYLTTPWLKACRRRADKFSPFPWRFLKFSARLERKSVFTRWCDRALTRPNTVSAI